MQTTQDTEELLPPPTVERSGPAARDEATAEDSATWPNVKFAKPALQRERQSQKKTNTGILHHNILKTRRAISFKWHKNSLNREKMFAFITDTCIL